MMLVKMMHTVRGCYRPV